MEIQTVTLNNFSSLRIGGTGKVCVVTTLKDLTEVVMYVNANGIKLYVLGEGTNTFFGSSPEVLIIKMMIRGVSVTEKDDTVFVTASAGEKWDDIVRFSVEKNLWGVENLSLIPGTVGAAPIQNIGAYGVELQDVLVSVSALDTETLELVEISKDACAFGYRDSLFKQKKGRYIIISVTIKLSKKTNPVLTYKPLDSLFAKENLTVVEVRDLVIKTRKSKIPDYTEYPNCGSFFKNPIIDKEKGLELQAMYASMPLIEHTTGYKIPAAWLIEHIADMKGKRVGDVGTWPNQPLVLVNYGAATPDDFISFSDGIIQKISEKIGVFLEKEVNYLA